MNVCDIKGCGKRTIQKVDSCCGYALSSETKGKPIINFKPFEKPVVVKVDLCPEHFKKWCEATYKIFYEDPFTFKFLKKQNKGVC